jgi:hypothetical protein
MSYNKLSTYSYKSAKKYEKPSIDDNTFVITNKSAISNKKIVTKKSKIQLECEILASNKATSWNSTYNDKTIEKLLATITYPVYHTLCRYEEDIGYDHRGMRAPYVSSIYLYIWSVLEGKPVVHQYIIEPRTKSYFFYKTYTEYSKICYLSVEDGWDDIDSDDTFLQVYNRIQQII